MDKKEFAFEVKDVSDKGEFEGYGSTFGGSPDMQGDVVAPGAFAASLVRHRRAGTMPLMLFGHNSSDLPIGNWDDIVEDGQGLRCKGAIDLEDSFGIRVYRQLKNKALRGLSIGFETMDSERDEDKPGVRILTELELWEISVVNFPANPRARVTTVKEIKDLRDRLAAGDRLTEREWEKVLKAEPFRLSNAEAERAVRINLKNGQGDPDGTAFLRAMIAA